MDATRSVMATPLHLPLLEPATHGFVHAAPPPRGRPPLYDLTPGAARNVLTSARSIPVNKPAASIEDTVFPAGPTGSVRIRIAHPESFTAPLHVVLHFHGGGWILGDKETH